MQRQGGRPVFLLSPSPLFRNIGRCNVMWSWESHSLFWQFKLPELFIYEALCILYSPNLITWWKLCWGVNSCMEYASPSCAHTDLLHLKGDEQLLWSLMNPVLSEKGPGRGPGGGGGRAQRPFPRGEPGGKCSTWSLQRLPPARVLLPGQPRWQSSVLGGGGEEWQDQAAPLLTLKAPSCSGETLSWPLPLGLTARLPALPPPTSAVMDRWPVISNWVHHPHRRHTTRSKSRLWADWRFPSQSTFASRNQQLLKLYVQFLPLGLGRVL